MPDRNLIRGALVFVGLLIIMTSCGDREDSGKIEAVSLSKPKSKTSSLDTIGFKDEYWTANDSVVWKQVPHPEWPERFSIGVQPTNEEIKKLDIDVGPTGVGLPAGKGVASDGRKIFTLKCAVCHGATGSEGPQNKLVTTWPDTAREKTIGNYWPYATTVFDYIRRSMPLNAPGSLSDEDVYALTAYLLAQNKIIDTTTVLSSRNLAKIEMPARKYYVNDSRKGGHETR